MLTHPHEVRLHDYSCTHTLPASCMNIMPAVATLPPSDDHALSSMQKQQFTTNMAHHACNID